MHSEQLKHELHIPETLSDNLLESIRQQFNEVFEKNQTHPHVSTERGKTNYQCGDLNGMRHYLHRGMRGFSFFNHSDSQLLRAHFASTKELSRYDLQHGQFRLNVDALLSESVDTTDFSLEISSSIEYNTDKELEKYLNQPKGILFLDGILLDGIRVDFKRFERIATPDYVPGHLYESGYERYPHIVPEQMLTLNDPLEQYASISTALNIIADTPKGY